MTMSASLIAQLRQLNLKGGYRSWRHFKVALP